VVVVAAVGGLTVVIEVVAVSLEMTDRDD